MLGLDEQAVAGHLGEGGQSQDAVFGDAAEAHELAFNLLYLTGNTSRIYGRQPIIPDSRKTMSGSLVRASLNGLDPS